MWSPILRACAPRAERMAPRRRHVLAAAAAGGIAWVLGLKPAGVKLDIPAIADSGNAVPLTVSAESPMTQENHVRSIFVFSERNPLPTVARFDLGLRAGRARVSTRIRLATSQSLLAVAQFSDGSLWSATAEV